jgi:hypothetical protein
MIHRDTHPTAMALTFDRRLVTSYEDPTASSRPAREALAPAEAPLGLFARLMAMPVFDEDDVVPRAVEMLPFVASWGD